MATATAVATEARVAVGATTVLAMTPADRMAKGTVPMTVPGMMSVGHMASDTAPMTVPGMMSVDPMASDMAPMTAPDTMWATTMARRDGSSLGLGLMARH